jgi:fructose-1,6-bisphosphatase
MKIENKIKEILAEPFEEDRIIQLTRLIRYNTRKNRISAPKELPSVKWSKADIRRMEKLEEVVLKTLPPSVK